MRQVWKEIADGGEDSAGSATMSTISAQIVPIALPPPRGDPVAAELGERVEDGDVVEGLAVVLDEGPAGSSRRVDEMGDLVGEVADDPAVDLRPEMGVAAASCRSSETV